MDDQEAANVAAMLAAAAAAMTAVTLALETGGRVLLTALYGLLSEMEGLDGDFAPIPAVHPSVRRAAVSLASALQAANSTLKSKLLAAEQLPADDKAWLLTLAPCLQRLATGLMALFANVLHGDSDLAFRIMAAGVCVVESGSLANSVGDTAASGTAVYSHTAGLLAVLHGLCGLGGMGEGHTRALTALRATTFRPEAILTALRRLLPGEGPPGSGGERECITGVLNLVLTGHGHYTIFSAELEAIEGDVQLQAGIVASLHRSIRRAAQLPKTASIDRAAFTHACTAIMTLPTPGLRGAARERALRDPTGFIRMLAACFDSILEGPLPALNQNEIALMQTVQRHALSEWGAAVFPAFAKDCSGRPPPVADLLGCLQRAAAAAAFVLQQPEAEADLQRALNRLVGFMSAIPDIYLVPGIDSGAAVAAAAGSSGAARRALFLEAVATLEGITRVLALLPARRPLGDFTDDQLVLAYTAVVDLIVGCFSSLSSPAGRPQPGVMTSQAALMAAAGAVDSLLKYALITANQMAVRKAAAAPPNAGALSFGAAHICFAVTRSVTAALLSDGQIALGDGTIKRWQGVALAAASTVTAVCGPGPSFFSTSVVKLLPMLLLCWPGARGLLLETPFRPAVLLGLSAVGEGEWRPLCSILGFAAESRRGGEAALCLAQLGALTQLASWGELQTGGPRPSDEHREVLHLTLELVARAVHSSDVAEVQAAYELIDSESTPDVGSAAYWRRLRAQVTEPLAAALEARAAAGKDPAQRAVDVAEALATRTCAHVGCTTVAGASEAAAPRGKRCGGCRLVRYCGAACQKADWPGHKAACRELVRRRAGGSRGAVRLTSPVVSLLLSAVNIEGSSQC